MEYKGQYVLFLLKISRSLNIFSSITSEYYYWEIDLF